MKLICGYCDGDVVKAAIGHEHATDGNRVTAGPGDFVSARHNRAGTRVNPMDVVEVGEFTAVINVPGYLSEQDEPVTFDTAREAWEYLAGERERAEEGEDSEQDGEDSDTLTRLRMAAGTGVAAAEMTYPDGTGVIYGDTPGGRMHDLGVAYSVIKTV